MLKTTDDIRQRVLAATTPKRVSPAPPVATKKAKAGSLLTMMFGCMIIFMSVAIFFAIAKKNRVAPISGEHVASQPVTKQDNPTPPVVCATKADVEAAFTSINKRLDEIDGRINHWSHRVWLLGVATNENAAVASGTVQGGYITFDENWKINRMPQSMEFNDEQKQKLQKDVR